MRIVQNKIYFIDESVEGRKLLLYICLEPFSRSLSIFFSSKISDSVSLLLNSLIISEVTVALLESSSEEKDHPRTGTSMKINLG